ncbi:MAG TPA: ATP-dependent Clp protease ATP-binding subunit, partial [Rhabdochlamydiaceae bacterium]|nr:ATP-dependent Clp protease ATP-binding subunit [Rhabdochlamydiaceae bacterium]
KTKLVAKDKINPAPQTTPPASYSFLDSIPGYTQFSQLLWGAPPSNDKSTLSETPQQPSLNRLWEQRDFPRLFDLLESEMNTPQGITWKPKANLDRLPKLKGPSTYINKFARDLTEEAMEGKLRPFVGREKEISLTAEILIRSQKSNPLLLGDPGVGKSVIPEGIAQLIVKNDEKLSPVFKGKRIYFIQWELLAAGARKYSDDTLEKRLSELIAEARTNKDQMILFIDEIHSFLKNDKESMAILKPALADGTISCIAATTPWDYKGMLAADPALERRFPLVHVKEPSDQEILAILKAFIPRLESHHGVHISKEAFEECLTLSKRFIRSESFPDKAIDLLDQAASFVSLSKEPPIVLLQDKKLAVFLDRLLLMRKEVDNPQIIDQKIQEISNRFNRTITADHIREIVSRKIDIPIKKLQEPEKHLLNNLEKLISEKIIGQKEPIVALSEAVRRGRLRIGSQDRPAGVFLMLGPTGVGKTATATVLSEILYGSKENTLRLDMSEFQQSHEISKLIGAPPGYIGHGSPGKLTDWLKKKPNSIVIFDEIEKAHPAVFDLLLQVFDAGRITDGNNETIRCLDTIFIMTSNIGADIILAKDGKIPHPELEKMIETKMDKQFRPEFINRIQESIIFHPLTEDQMLQIVRLQCKELKERVEHNVQCPNLTLQWDEFLITFLAKTSFNPKKGARELSRQITKAMENPIANLIINDKIVAGDHLFFTAVNGRIELLVNQKPVRSR